MKSKVQKKKSTKVVKISSAKRVAKKKTTRAKGKSPRTQPVSVLKRLASSHTTRRVAYSILGFLALAGAGVYFVHRETGVALPTHTPPIQLGQVTQSPKLSPDPLAEEFKNVESLSFNEKMQFWSSYIEKNLKGRLKLFSLASTAQLDDAAPIVPSEYNCTTFVETVAALARSQSSSDIVKNIVAIRYRDGQPSFQNRNHFPEADWIPNNEKSKILTDITGKIASRGGVLNEVERKQVDRGKWLTRQMRNSQVSRNLATLVSKDWSTPTQVQVNYIAISQVKKVLDQIPNGTILNLVHKDDGLHPVLITHQGIVVRENGRVLLRHASIGGRIRTNDLYVYLHHLEKQQGRHLRWPLIGVNLNQINDSTSTSSLLREAM